MITLRKLRQNPQISLNELWGLTQKLAVPFTDQDLDNLIEEYSQNGRLDVQRLSQDVQVLFYFNEFFRSRLENLIRIF
jgi:hypothetical protein